MTIVNIRPGTRWVVVSRGVTPAELELVAGDLSTIEADLAAVVSEVTTAREGEASLNIKLNSMQADTAAVVAEVTTAREGEASLNIKLNSMQADTAAVVSEVTTAREGEASLNVKLNSMQADTAAVEDALDNVQTIIDWDRPADNLKFFTRSIAGGDVQALTPIDANLLVWTDEGQAVKLTDPDDGIDYVRIAVRHKFYLEPARRYRARWMLKRAVNSPDPLNDAIVPKLAWYESTLVPSTTNATTSLTPLAYTTGDGWHTVTAVVARAAATGVDHVAPADARFCTPFLDVFGETQQTHLVLIDFEPLETEFYSPDLTALEDQINALESIDAGNRLDVLETYHAAPDTQEFEIRNDVVAATIGATVNQIRVHGWDAIDDGKGALLTREASEPLPIVPAWTASTAYLYGDEVSNDGGKIYTCVRDGTSAAVPATGPSGTGNLSITDGTAIWIFSGATDWRKVQSADGAWWQVAPQYAERNYYKRTSGGAVTRRLTKRLDDQINLLDFIPESEHAAIYTCDSTYDCSDAMEAALAAVQVVVANAVFKGGPEIVLPYGQIRLSRTIQLIAGTTLRGHGCTTGNAGSSSIIQMEPYVEGTKSGHGIIFLADGRDYFGNVVPTFGAGTSHISDFEIRGGLVDDPNATVGHGIWARGRFTAERVLAVNFPQDGWYLSADSGASGVNYGNINNSHIIQGRAGNNGRHGFFVNGGDANACQFDHIDCTGNWGHGIWDSSFLGNTWIAPHCRDNGGGSLTVHLGSLYQIKSDAAAADGPLVEPGVTPGWEDTWELIGAGDSNPLFQTWSSKNTYIHARSIYCDSDSVTGGLMISPYTEGGIPLKSLKSPWVVIDSVGAPVHKVADNATYFTANTISPFSIGINDEDDPTALLTQFKRTATDVIAFQAGPGDALSLNWDDVVKTFNIRFGTITPALTFTTDMSETVTAGRGFPIFKGRAVLPNGMWLGDSLANARHMSNVATVPTTGEWAQGDIVWNRAADQYGIPGWICTTGGAATTTAWNDFTAYSIESNQNSTLRKNGANTYRVVSGTSAASGGPTGTGTDILDGSVAWDYQAGTAWKPGDSVTQEEQNKVYYNGGPKAPDGIVDGPIYWAYKSGGGGSTPWANDTYYSFGNKVTNAGNTYVSFRPGMSESAPTGTGDIADGTAAWRTIPPRTTSIAYLAGEYAVNDAAVWVCTTPGTSGTGSGPQLPGPTAVDGTVTWTLVSPTPPDWLPNTAYTDGDIIYSATRAYLCVTTGTSASASYYIPRAVGSTGGTQGTGPRGTGEIVDGVGTLRWINEWSRKATLSWAPNTAYAIGDLRLRNGYTYVVTQAGTSGPSATLDGPTGRGIWDGDVVWNYIQPWRADTRYIEDEYAVNDTGKLYKVVPGISGATGPTGTGTGILDGSVLWDYCTPPVFTPISQMALEKHQTITDAAVTLSTTTGSPYHTLFDGTLTTGRTVTLSGSEVGRSFRITRTADGAFNLTIGSSLTFLAQNEWCIVTRGESAWYVSQRGRLYPDVAQQIIDTDVAFTLTPYTSAPQVVHTGTLTANRIVTLSTGNAYAGHTWRITRTGGSTGGPFYLQIGNPALTFLAQDEYAEIVYNGTAYYLARRGRTKHDGPVLIDSAASGAVTLTPFNSPPKHLFTGTLTANRTINLSTTNAYNGVSFRVTRTGGGAFNLNVGTGPLKALATNTWGDFTYDGSAWYLSAYGAL